MSMTSLDVPESLQAGWTVLGACQRFQNKASDFFLTGVLNQGKLQSMARQGNKGGPRQVEQRFVWPSKFSPPNRSIYLLRY